MPSVSTQYVTIPVSDSTTLSAYLATPDDHQPHPGMLVFQEAFGVNPHIRDVTERFAGEGYIAIAPELFHRTAPGFQGSYTAFEEVRPHVQALTVETLTADIRATFDWLMNDKRIDSSLIFSTGFCMGGRVSFLANAILPLKGAISFYGGGIAPNPTSPGLLDRASAIHAPMLFFWGGLDKHISPDDIRAVTDSLRQAGKEFVNVEFSKADHGFFCDKRSSFHPAAAKQSWGLALSFLSSLSKGTHNE